MYAEIFESERAPALAEQQGPTRRPGRALPFYTGGLAKARRQTAEQARALVEELATDHRWTGLVHERVSRSRAHTIGRIVEAVIGLVDRAGYCWASAETIADYAGCDRSTVFRLWPEIEFAGLLVSVRQAHGPNRVYLGATLIDRMLALLNTTGWAANPASPFWLRYRQWLGQSVAYRHSRAALEPSALKSRLNLTPNCHKRRLINKFNVPSTWLSPEHSPPKAAIRYPHLRSHRPPSLSGR